MKNLKKQPTKQLEKFSNIFTQLGLVLVLFIVYITLEYKTEQEKIPILGSYLPETVYIADTEVFFTKEVKKVKIPTPPPTICFVNMVKKGDNDIVETIIDNPVDKVVELNPEDIIEVKIPDPEGPETVPFILIENAPVFKGCENLSKEENKRCFDKKIKQFVQYNFDIDLANELGLNAGKHKIYTEFVIDKQGNIIDVKVRAPHKQLEKEANRLIKKLPQFTPGKQREKPVKVKYSLPIAFRVQ